MTLVAAALAALPLPIVAASCGGGDETAGFAPVSDQPRLDAGKDADGAFDLGSAWPDADLTGSAAPDASPGFDASPPETGPPPPTCAGRGAPGNTVVSIPWGGMTRTAELHVPPSYDGNAATPLILNFHGFSSNGPEEVLLTRMSAASDKHGFVVAYPEGVATSWNAGKCCGTAWANAVDDVGFVKALVEKLSSDLCIDPRRIYATGMSNGGFLSNRLGCEMSDTFAAIAPVAGVLGIDFDACKPGRVVPVLHTHGTQDPLVPYAGGNPVLNVGLTGTLDFPSVAASVGRWREINGCDPQSTTLFHNGDATCTRWGCVGGSEVVLCTIDGGGHTWPGGLPIPFLGKTSTDIDATEAIISFFAAHPMP